MFGKVAVSALVACALATPASASPEQDMMTCLGIPSDPDRLACYDAASKLMISRFHSSQENEILKRFKKNNSPGQPEKKNSPD